MLHLETASNITKRTAAPGINVQKLPTILKKEILDFINQFVDFDADSFKIVETSSRLNIEFIEEKIDCFINLRKVNDIRFLNKFFETVNEKLNNKGIFIGCVETIEDRKQRIFNKHHPIVAVPFYAIDFVYKRIFPKFKLTKKLYFSITQGKNRVLSKAETLGRLVSCGFEIIEYNEIKGLLYFVCRKKSEPLFDLNPSYGPLFKMKRVGRNGKMIYVYKVRTMHPYAEYMQKFIYDIYGTTDGVKFDNDFRVTSWGRFMRRIWIDELPQLVNLVKGELKIVGVRPLSMHKFSIYPPHLQKKRVKYKPGLIPPTYVEIPKSVEEMMSIEEKYLDAYEKNPFVTDWKYFWRALNNILFKRVRSS